MLSPGYGGETSVSVSELLLNVDGLKKISGTLLTGLNLADGTVLGLITASGKYKNYDDTAVDGSAVAVGILSGKCDTTTVAGDKQIIVNIGGIYKDKDDLTGYDAAALVDLVGRLIGDVLVF